MKFALFGLALVLSVSAAATCIVSGDTSRDAAASGMSVIDGFDSSAFDIAITPAVRNFNSRPVGMLINFY